MEHKKEKGHLIEKVLPESIAAELGIEPGDRLLSIGGNQIGDIFDYQYYMEDTYVEILIEKPDGEQWLLQVDKEEDEGRGMYLKPSLPLIPSMKVRLPRYLTKVP